MGRKTQGDRALLQESNITLTNSCDSLYISFLILTIPHCHSAQGLVTFPELLHFSNTIQRDFQNFIYFTRRRRFCNCLVKFHGIGLSPTFAKFERQYRFEFLGSKKPSARLEFFEAGKLMPSSVQPCFAGTERTRRTFVGRRPATAARTASFRMTLAESTSKELWIW